MILENRGSHRTRRARGRGRPEPHPSGSRHPTERSPTDYPLRRTDRGFAASADPDEMRVHPIRPPTAAFLALLLGLVLDDVHADDEVAFAKVDALHAHRVAAHRADVLDWEATAHALGCPDEHVLTRRHDARGQKPVAFTDRDTEDPRLPDALLRAQARALHAATPGAGEQITFVDELANRQNRGDTLVRLHAD